jgi:opacity protein-like surface antigen
VNVKVERSESMRKGVVLAFVVVGVFLMTLPGPAQENYKKFTLKVSGGYGSISGGDLTTVADGINDQLADIAALAGASTSGELANAKWGPEFEGEFVYNFTERWGLGLGVGYVRKSIESGVELQVGTYARVSFDWEPVYKVIPLTLNGYYSFSVASKMNAYVKGGVGYYFATWDYKIRQENELLGITIWDENEGTAKDSGLGFQGGLGFEFNLSDSAAIFVEGTGRYVNLKDWDVDNLYRSALGSERDRGTFWYIEEFEEDTGKYYPSLELSDEEPSDPDFRNVRKAEVGLSGIVFKVGIKFSF